MRRTFVLLIVLFLLCQPIFSQNTTIKIRVDGEIPKNHFIRTFFGEQGYDNDQSYQGDLEANLDEPGKISIAMIRKNGRIVGRTEFWVGEGEYTITGSTEDIDALGINPLHPYEKLDQEWAGSSPEVKKELIIENLDDFFGLYWLNAFIANYGDEELSEVLGMVSDELKTSPEYMSAKATLDTRSLKKAKVGEMYRDFSLESRDGGEVAVSDFDGKYRILEFSFTGCLPCIEALPEVKEVHDRFGNQVEVITIWQDKTKEIWLESSKEHKDLITWTDLWDQSSFATDLYGVNVWPTYILINPEGEIETIWNSYRKGRLIRKVENLFSKP